MSKQKSIFKVGDKVFDAQIGWGKVIKIRPECNFPVIVSFKGSIRSMYTAEGKGASLDKIPSLSFTEYDFVNGGFSQKRPK
ncbi:hypothetical protein [Ornithobacterium rhinotracheale]|uniref:hypothetical protein n=1 Tax=Ornithobacterium rhinotracheale TaxID=28251 RepID=UPI00403A7BBC